MPTNRPFQLAMAFFLVLHAVLLFSMPLLPFIDLPNHLSEAAIYKYGGDEGSLIGQYYEAVPGFYPNTFHTVFCSLFPSVEFGNKVFHVLYIFLLLWSVSLVIRELGGNQWYGLLCIFFIYNFNTAYGFVGFAIAIPTVILLFYTTLLDSRSPRFGYTVAASLLLVLLFLMHAQVALFGLLLYGCMMLYAFWGRWGTLVLRGVVAALPVVAMVVIWWLHRTAEQAEESTLTFLVRHYKEHYIQEFSRRFLLVLYDQLALLGGRNGLILALSLSGLLFLPLLFFPIWKRVPRGFFRKRALVYPSIFLFISAGCYFVLPKELPGQAPLYERFCTLVYLSFIILVSVLLKDVTAKSLRYYVVAACLLYSGLWAEYLYSFNRENRDFTPAFFSGVVPQKKLGGLIYAHQFRKREVYLHFPNYNLVWNGGLVTSKIIDFRFGVVRKGPKGGEIPLFEEWQGQTYKVVPSLQDSVHYILQRGRAPVSPDPNLAHYAPLRQAGSWSLYRNTRLP